MAEKIPDSASSGNHGVRAVDGAAEQSLISRRVRLGG